MGVEASVGARVEVRMRNIVLRGGTPEEVEASARSAVDAVVERVRKLMPMSDEETTGFALLTTADWVVKAVQREELNMEGASSVKEEKVPDIANVYLKVDVTKTLDGTHNVYDSGKPVNVGDAEPMFEAIARFSPTPEGKVFANLLCEAPTMARLCLMMRAHAVKMSPEEWLDLPTNVRSMYRSAGYVLDRLGLRGPMR